MSDTETVTVEVPYNASTEREFWHQINRGMKHRGVDIEARSASSVQLELPDGIAVSGRNRHEPFGIGMAKVTVTWNPPSVPEAADDELDDCESDEFFQAELDESARKISGGGEDAA